MQSTITTPLSGQQTEEECCPEFHPEKWDEKSHTWDNKPFIEETIPTLFHMPFPPMIGSKVTKMSKLAEDAWKMETDKEETLLLFRDPSAFRSELYLSVTGPVPGANNVSISGNFISKVFFGPYNAIPTFIKEMEEYLTTQNKKVTDYYIHYAYCPKCAEKHGRNYLILFAQV